MGRCLRMLGRIHSRVSGALCFLEGGTGCAQGQSNMQYPIGKPGCYNKADTNCTHGSPQCVCSPKGEYPDNGGFPHGCGCINDTTAEIAALKSYPAIRLLQIFPTSQAAPLLEAANSGWRSAPQLAKHTCKNLSSSAHESSKSGVS